MVLLLEYDESITLAMREHRSVCIYEIEQYVDINIYKYNTQNMPCMPCIKFTK